MPVISPYLESLWNRVLPEKGWTTKQLAEAAGVSYGYTRKIVNGTLIPSRDALRRLCRAADLDFGVAWRGLHSDPVATMGPAHDDLAPRAAKFFSHFREKVFESPDGDDADDHLQRRFTREEVNSVEEDIADLVRERVKELMNTLPLTGVGELLQRAKELSQKYNPQRLETEDAKS